jgi:hypothetical protein
MAQSVIEVVTKVVSPIEQILLAIINYNYHCDRKVLLKVVPECCYLYDKKSGTTQFVEEVMKAVETLGTLDISQQPEEIGAVGQAYLIDINVLLGHFGFAQDEPND